MSNQPVEWRDFKEQYSKVSSMWVWESDCLDVNYSPYVNLCKNTNNILPKNYFED